MKNVKTEILMPLSLVMSTSQMLIYSQEDLSHSW
jgi:hypothetical protein